MDKLFVSIESEAEMIAVGKTIAADLKVGDVVALNGQLGVGKTHLSKGIVAGLGSVDEVTSPTFSLVQEYQGASLPIFHFDFYRLDDVSELLRLGWDEYLDEDGVILVEWADKFPDLMPEGTCCFDLAIKADGRHTVTER